MNGKMKEFGTGGRDCTLDAVPPNLSGYPRQLAPANQIRMSAAPINSGIQLYT